MSEEEAVIATSLGLQPYKKPPLRSNTYQALLRILSFFPSENSGEKVQENEDCVGKNNYFVESEVVDRVEIEEPALISCQKQATDASISDSAANEIVDSISVGQSLFAESADRQVLDSMDYEQSHVSVKNVVSGREDVAQKKEIDVVGDTVMTTVEIEDGEISDDMEADDMAVNDPPEDPVRDSSVEISGRSLEGTYEKFMLSILSPVGSGNSREKISLRGVRNKNNRLDNSNSCKVEIGKECCEIDRSRLAGEISGTVVTENEGMKASVKNTEASLKVKRVITQERKEKKRAKRRKQRAEQDRLSGVKRLRLQPNLKPKKVNYCKYYLNGKCQQGDACKFSHDITPLTKSKPCNFFAVGKCLKGEDCPYDHDLSKYPCNNYTTQGFCHRGDACLFSHKILPTNEASPASTQEVSSLQGSANAGKQQTDKGIISKQIPKSTIPRTPAQMPKGISFLSFGKTPSDDPSKQQKGDLLPGTPDILGRSPASTLSLSQPSSMVIAQRQDKNMFNSVAKAPPSSSSQYTSSYESKVMNRSLQPPPVSSIPTVSSILQEFLFNGQ
ncbi:hypothetical protein ACHQM5_001390 [Ranunculus cassubicifolius]